jgi:phospholipid/cholesterol/gamma-HCH transport system substrate-binding protein
MNKSARVGLITILGMVGFALVLFVIADRSFWFSDTFVVRSTFNNVAGLKAGATVQFQGINVGRVERVQLPLEPNGKIEVSMAITEEARPLIRTNTQALIKGEGLVGDMLVVFVSGEGPARMVEDGDVIEGVDPFDLFEITDKALASVQKFEQAAITLEEIMTDVRQGEGTLGKIIYDSTLYVSIVETAGETQRFLSSAANNAEALVALAREATGGVETILNKIDQGEGSLALLLNDPGLYNGLLATADTLQSLSRDLQLIAGTAETTTSWASLGAFRFAELMEAAKENWLFKRYFEERGFVERADFEARERALAQSYDQLNERIRELQAWEDRLRDLQAEVDARISVPSSGPVQPERPTPDAGTPLPEPVLPAPQDSTTMAPDSVAID